MTRYTTLFSMFIVCFLLLTNFIHAKNENADSRPPNIVIIFIDDMGYADIGPFGAKGYQTPHLDQMAKEGRIFTDFHSATAVCSASRAALMTGCYPERVSIRGALSPKAKHGLNPEETTIAELCKQKGYATAVYGKWHLGHLKPFLPLQHGFDEYFGLPYSNDMWPQPDVQGDPVPKRRQHYPKLPLYENNRIVDSEVTAADQAQLTTWYTERAVDFIDRNSKQPFFLYLPHTMVHVPIFVSDKFKGKSEQGLYGDVVMELDWSVGQVLEALKRNGIDDNTLVVFTSDNGPWLNYGNHAGSASPLREGKGTMFEGGYREPCVMRWPEKIPAGTKCDEFSTTMDMLPTIAKLIDVEISADRPIDGKDILPLMTGEPDAKSPHDSFVCYYGGEMRAIRDPRWKLHLPHEYRTLAGKEGGKGGYSVPYDHTTIGHELFDLKNDVGETTDVAAEHPEIVARLKAEAERMRTELGDRLTKQSGTQVRPAGQLE